jgi:hypothetical protein
MANDVLNLNLEVSNYVIKASAAGPIGIAALVAIATCLTVVVIAWLFSPRRGEK